MPAGRFGVLRDPRFRRYAAGQGVSLVGDGISLVALSFAVLSIGGSTTDVGVVIGAQTLGIGAFALIGGVWADRFPRRRIMIASDLVRMLVQAIVAVLLLSGHASVRSLIASALVFGCAEGVFGPSAVGLLPRIVEEGMLTSANAAISLLHTMGLVIGPVIAGFVIAASSPGAAVALDAVTFAISVAFLAGVVPRAVAAAGAPDRFVAALLGGLRLVRRRRWLTGGVASIGLYCLLSLPSTLALGPVFCERELSGASSWAVISTGFGVGSAVGGVIAFRVRPARPGTATALLLAVGALQPAVIALGGSAVVSAILIAVCGAAITVAFAGWETALGERLEHDQVSRVSSIDYFAAGALAPLGFAAVGPLAAALGLRATMVALSLTAVAASLTLASWLRASEAPTGHLRPEGAASQ